jgi:hypothetical protein
LEHFTKSGKMFHLLLLRVPKFLPVMVRLCTMRNRIFMITSRIRSLFIAQWLAAFALMACFVLPVFSQSDILVDRMQINIWPEYDRRSILVIYRLSLDQQTSLPAEVTISIPSSAQVPFNVAFEDVDGMLYTMDYTVTQNGRWVDVTFTTPSPGVQLEFYDPEFERDGDQRQYEYTWPGNFDVEAMSVLIQEPSNAISMTIRPDIGSGRQGADGMVIYTAMIGEVEAGRTFSYKIEYEKPDDELVTPPMTVQPVEPVDALTPGRTTMMEMIPWVLGSLGVLLIAVGAFWYWRAGRDIPEPPRKRQSTGRAKEELASASEEQVYCHQCGKRAAPTDLYCRTCGTKLQHD